MKKFIFIILFLISEQQLSIAQGWHSIGVPIGTNGTVRSTVCDKHGNLYIAGSFTTAGGVLVNNIAKWDGNNWTPLGTGTNSTIYSIAIDTNGILYAGGIFNIAGGSPVNRIAKWDGTTWSAIGTGTTSGTIFTIAFDSNNNVIVGGSFTSIGGITSNRIAKWNGSAWSALGIGFGSTVNAVAVDAVDNVYAGGNFTNYISKWDGISWSTLGSGIDGAVRALSFDNSNNLYVGGTFLSAGGLPANGIAKWDGNNWFSFGAGSPSGVYCLGIDAGNNLYISTASPPNKTLKWDGIAWQEIASTTVYSMATYDYDLYAGGYFSSINGISANHIAHWNGNKWLAFGSGADKEVWAIADDGHGNIYVGGEFTSIGGIQANHIAKWDGTTWSSLGAGLGFTTNDCVYSITIDSNGIVYAGGRFDSAGTIIANNIAKWDGISWDSLGAGIYGPVYSIVTDTLNNLYVGGDFAFTGGGLSARHIAKWNGSSWSALDIGCGFIDDDVWALAIDKEQNIYAAGVFGYAGSTFTNTGSLAKWDGTSWSAIGGPVLGSISALTIDNYGHPIIAGILDSAAGVPLQKIAIWNDTTWSELGSLIPVPGTSYTFWGLAVDSNNNIYFGGNMLSASGVLSNAIVKWDGSSWSDIASPLYDNGPQVYTLHMFEDCKLFAGGRFTDFSGVLSGNIAWYDLNGLPSVSLDLTSVDTLCANSLPVLLTGGLPIGGIYSGVGVSGNIFDPSIAGDGVHTINYFYNDTSSCASYAMDCIYVSLCTTINENESSKSELIIFPNPASDEINISIKQEFINDYIISIYNILGEEQKIEMNRSIISISSFSPGIYFLVAESNTGEKRLVRKFIKI